MAQISTKTKRRTYSKELKNYLVERKHPTIPSITYLENAR